MSIFYEYIHYKYPYNASINYILCDIEYLIKKTEHTNINEQDIDELIKFLLVDGIKFYGKVKRIVSIDMINKILKLLICEKNKSISEQSLKLISNSLKRDNKNITKYVWYHELTNKNNFKQKRSKN